MPSPDNNITGLAWNILFGEDDPFLDYSKPENQPRLKALRKAKYESLKIFLNGQGKALFDHWKEKIRRDTLSAITDPISAECSCRVCQKIREIKFLLGLIMQIETFISEEDKAGQTQIRGD